jgi:hypothetical protein
MEVIPDAAAEPPVTATVTAVPQFVHPHDEASPEFTKELELTIHMGEVPSRMLPCSKFVRKYPKAKLPLLPLLHLTRALVRLTVVNY